MAGDQKRFQAAMRHAEQFSQAGKWAEAMKAYRFALAEFPNNIVAIVGFGKVGLAAGQTDLAQRAFQQVLKINPTNLEALNYMGDIQERLGRLDAAAETYLRIGNVYASRNNLNPAIDSWTRATKLASGQVEAHRKLAEALTHQGEIRPAAREFLTLAAIYQRRKDLERAEEQVSAAQELLPDDPGVSAALAALQEGTPIQPDKIGEAPPPEVEEVSDFVVDFVDEDPFSDEELFAPEDLDAESSPLAGLVDTARQNAMAELANVIFEDSDNPSTMLIMQALDLQSRDNLVEAASNYRQAIQTGASQPAIYFVLGLLYKEQGQLSQATEMLKVSAQDQNYDMSSQFVLGETYYAAQDLDSALKHFVEALKVIDLQTVSGQKSYELAQTYGNLADSYMAQGDTDKITKFITSLENFFADPNWERKVFEARQRMNNIAEDGQTMSLAEFLETPETEVMVTTLALTSEYLKRNMLMTASEECLRAIQKAPAYLPLHIRLADILLKQERTDESITKYLYIAKVYQMRNQLDQAVNIYQKILKLAPMDVTVRSKLIDLYTAHHNLTEALEQYLILADSYYQLAQVDRALEKYNEALRLAASTDNPDSWKMEALTRIADIYNQRFDWANATSALEEILKINPEDEPIKLRLVDLYFKQYKLNEAITILDDLLAIYQRQDPIQALELLKEFSSSYPDDMSLRQRLAVAYAQNDMIREAITEYDALGEMQMENGLRDEAIQTIQAIINLGPDDVEGYHRLLQQIGGSAV